MEGFAAKPVGDQRRHRQYKRDSPCFYLTFAGGGAIASLLPLPPWACLRL
jgi:hypothetical protein